MGGDLVRSSRTWLALILVLACPALSSLTSFSQSAPVTESDPVLPKDPNAAMQLAARVNGLASADMKSWHLKANYQTFDADGKPKDQGVFEEWWAGSEKYKISYASKSFNQVQYRNGEKTLMTGDVKWPPSPQLMVWNYLVHPLPTLDANAQRFYSSELKVGNVPLRCMRFYPQMGPGELASPDAPPPLPMYCFDKVVPAVRLIALNQRTVVYFDNIISLGGQFVAKQIRVMDITGKHPLVNIDVDALENLTNLRDADFVPPASATPAPARRIAVSAGVIAGRKIGGDDVRYPLVARQQRVQGTVVLGVTIAADGTVKDLKVISGPMLLQDSAFQAVTTWRYKPFLLNGEPVEVMTQVNVTYTLGG